MITDSLYMYWILFFLKNFVDYEKIDVRIQILKRHKLNPQPTPKTSSQWRFSFKIGLQSGP